MNIQPIIFSKCRTLQLKSLLLSLKMLSDIKLEDVIVSYRDSDKISYEGLKKEFPCRFIRQTNTYNDLMDILKNSKPLIQFMVDDLIFRDKFSYSQIERLFETDLDCFSLRLGKNIKDGRQPDFKEPEPSIISWKTTDELGMSWNYFWEISCSIYRKELILDYLKHCSAKIAFPNPFEYYYYRVVPNVVIGTRGLLSILKHPRYLLWLLNPNKRIKKMACYDKSRAFTQGVNQVAGRDSNYNTLITPEKLHELYLKGYTIDFKCLKDVNITKPNAGREYFRIVGPRGEKHPLSLY